MYCVPLPLHRVEVDGLSYCSVLAKESAEVAEELIQLKVVHGLMVAVGNLDYPLSQRNASISLEVSVRVYNGWHHSNQFLYRTLEQKGSLHCFSEVFVCFWAQQTDFTMAGVALRSGNNCTTCSVCFLPASHHKEGTGKLMFTLTHLFYSAACPGGWHTMS